jgi:dethiobiotin synthetase
MNPIFITGIGTDVGKTIAAAVVTEALGADYWKPVQAGYADGTDALTMRSLVSNPQTVIHPEAYKLSTPASPHIAARNEGLTIDLATIQSAAINIENTIPNKPLVIEGAGGLLVPLNEHETVADMILALRAKVILVSRNYLGSINHSLMTANCCRTYGIPVLGWIFNDDYMQYEQEIVDWTGYPSLGAIHRLEEISSSAIQALALQMKPALMKAINRTT